MSAHDADLDRHVVQELRAAAVRASGAAARAHAEANAAWREYRQALRDQAEDAGIIGRQLWRDRLQRARRNRTEGR